MSIAVQFQNDEDRQEAEQIADNINNNYSFSAFTTKADSINFSSFDGVIVVGGSNANDVYQEMVNKHGWSLLFCGNEFFGDTGLVTEAVKEEDCIVQGVAGCTAEDTGIVTDWYLGESVSQTSSLNFYGAGIDDFLERVSDNLNDGDGDEIEDPTDPILDPSDPDNDDGDSGAVPDMPVRVIVEGQKLNLPDVEPYSFTVDGWAKEVDSKFSDLGTPQGQPYKDHTFQGKTGGGDKDVYVLSEDAVITDFEADGDKRVVINGSNYNYNSDKDRFEEDFIPFFGEGGDEDSAEHIEDEEKTQETIDKENKRQHEGIWDKLGLDSRFDKMIAGIVVLILLFIFAQASSGQDINIEK